MRGEDQIFADGVGTIAVAGSTIRIEFVSLMATDRDPGSQPKMAVSHRLVMPIEGFASAVGKLQETVQALVQRGILRPQGAPELVAEPARVAVVSDRRPVEAPRTDPAPVAQKPASRPFP